MLKTIRIAIAVIGMLVLASNFVFFEKDEARAASDITVLQGQSGSTVITATLAPDASTEEVTFNAPTGLPSGTTFNYNPTSCTPTCTTTLTIITSGSTPAGTYPITVTSEPLSKSTTFNLIVTAQTLSVTLSTTPTSGTPTTTFTSTATVSGSAFGTINYSFWKNCSDVTTNPSTAETSCGALPTGVPVGTCQSNSVGTKCEGVTETTKNFTSSYAAAGTYKPKIIVERGSAPPAQNNTQALTVAWPALTASCSVSPTNTLTYHDVTWSVTASGGTGSYTYAWAGENLDGKTGASETVQYTTEGTKTGSVTVTSGPLTITPTCPSVTIARPTLSITATTTPTSGTWNLDTQTTVTVSGSATGPITYSFWKNCANPTNTPSVANADPSCGALPVDPGGDESCTLNSAGIKCEGVSAATKDFFATYTAAGTFTPKIIVERADATSVESRKTVTVSNPIATVNIKANDSDGPITIAYNTAATVSWLSTNTTACSVATSTTPIWTGTSGSQSTEFLLRSQTYTLNCTGVAGDTPTDSVVVNVAPPTLSATVNVTPTTGQAPLTTTISATTIGTAVGTTNYSFWWNCASTSNDIATVSASCGSLPAPISGTCTTNASGAKCDNIASTTQSILHTYTLSGNVTPKVIVERDTARSEARTSLTVTAPPPVPDIKANNSDAPPMIEYGQSATLTWTSANATSCAVNPQTASGTWTGTASPAGGQTTGSLFASTVYVLTCTGPGGEVSDSVTVNVGDATLSATLSASPNSGPTPFTTTLNASVSGNAIGTINYNLWWNCSDPTTNIAAANTACGPLPPGVGGTCQENQYGVKCDGINQTTFSYAHTYDTPQNYTPKLIVERGSAPNAGSATFVGALPPSPIADIKANDAQGPTAVPHNTSADISWISTNADSCSVSVNNQTLWTGLSGNRASDPLTVPQNFLLNCSGPGGTVSDAVLVNIIPTVTLTQSKTTTVVNEPFTIAWSSTNATECVVQKNVNNTGWVDWATGTAGTQEVAPLTIGEHRWRISCSGPGGSATANFTHAVLDPELGVILTASPSSGIGRIDPATLTATVSGTAVGSITYYFWWNCDSLSTDAAATAITCGALPSPPPENTCTQNSAGALCYKMSGTTQSVSAIYTVGNFVPKVIVTRSIKSATWKTNVAVAERAIPAPDAAINQSSEETTSGDPVYITWSSTNATSCTIEKNVNGGAWTFWDAALSGERTAYPVEIGTHTWRMTCSGEGGSDEASIVHRVIEAQIGVNLIANPNTGTAPLNTELTATLSGGSLGTVNYSFWWNCADPTTSVQTASAICGQLPSPISGQCVTNDAGAKCDNIPASLYKIPHQYENPGTFTPKVIAERGSAAPQEARATVRVSEEEEEIVPQLLSVSCYVSSRTVPLNEPVLWIAYASGGTGPYTYQWSGDAPLGGSTENPVEVRYSTTGAKRGTVTVTSGGERASCSNTVTVITSSLTFSANPLSIYLPDRSTLSWDAQNFSTCRITDNDGVATNDIGAVSISGSRSVSPTVTTTYTLSCSSPLGSETRQVTIFVGKTPSFREIPPR